MRLYDGACILDISMYENDLPDYAEDFFEAGGLPYDDLNDWYSVEDRVEYCLEQAADWRDCKGDYQICLPDMYDIAVDRRIRWTMYEA